MLTTEKIIGTVGYPGGIGTTPEPFTFALARAFAFAQESVCGVDEHIHLDRSRISLHDHARNQIVEKFQGDWLLMLDCDMDFQPDFIARLVAMMTRTGVDVLTGIYSYRQPPHWPVLYMWNPNHGRHEVIASWDRNSDLFRVDSAGAGCLLVKRSVFDRIKTELNEKPFSRIGEAGEDHSFFARLRKLQIPAYCAWKIEAKHLEYVGISTAQDFDSEANPPEEFYVTEAQTRVA